MEIRVCDCGREILTTEQMKKNKPCRKCQEEHAREFQNKYGIKKEGV